MSKGKVRRSSDVSRPETTTPGPMRRCPKPVKLDKIWDQLFPPEQTRIIKLMIEKVIVSLNKIELRLRDNGIERLVLELRQPAV